MQLLENFDFRALPATLCGKSKYNFPVWFHFAYHTADGKASEATIRKEQRNPPNNSSNLSGIHFKYTKMEIFVEGKVKKCFKYKSFFGNFNYMK